MSTVFPYLLGAFARMNHVIIIIIGINDISVIQQCTFGVKKRKESIQRRLNYLFHSKTNMIPQEEAKVLDSKFSTKRDEFNIPTLKSMKIDPNDESQITYLCGNSLGLMPKQTRKYISDELDAWSNSGVESHFDHPKTCWMDIDLPVIPLLAPLVGGKETEVGVMGTLTGNLNSLLAVFYNPKGKKSKILFEKGAFPSDYYAFLNQVKLHKNNIVGDKDNSSFQPKDYLIQIAPKDNEYVLHTDDILKIIEENHEEIALICLPGIQYYSGQLFEINKITAFAKQFDLIVGWDLAHAVGNVPLDLHSWNVDFACWCSYKYLNAGPGGIGGYFIHEKYSTDTDLPRLAGWWGNNEKVRFQMKEEFDPIKGALGFRQSNPSVLDVVSLQSSLDIFKSVSSDMYESRKILREKSVALTNFLEKCLTSSKHYVEPCESVNITKKSKPCFTIITPADSKQRGAQLSLLFLPVDSELNVMEFIFSELRNGGIIGDERRPNVIRLAPTPLYNTFSDVAVVSRKLDASFDRLIKQ